MRGGITEDPRATVKQHLVAFDQAGAAMDQARAAVMALGLRRFVVDLGTVLLDGWFIAELGSILLGALALLALTALPMLALLLLWEG